MGTLERDTITLSAPVTEQINAIFVKEGDIVVAGEALIQLDTTKAKLRVAQATANLEQAKFELKEKQNGARIENRQAAKASYEAAKATEEKAHLAYKRTKALYKKQTIGQAELDNTKTEYQQKIKLTKERLSQWLVLENGSRPEQISQLNAKVAALEATLQLSLQSLYDLTITAPAKGTVIQLPWVAGNRVNTNAPLIRLAKKSTPYAQVYLPQTTLNVIHKSQHINVWIDGYPKPFRGIVRYIRPQPAFTPYYALNEQDRSRLMYLTKIDIKNADSLPSGLNLEIHLP